MDELDRLIDAPILGGQSLADMFTLSWMLGLGGRLLVAALIFSFALWFSGFIARRIRNISEKRPHIDDTLFGFLGNIARWAILLIGFTLVLNNLGVQTTSIIAAMGAAGLAIGLALQGTLTNLAAGVMIVVFRPFNKGNFVEVAGKMGTVKDISLFTTELASLDNVQHVVPNSSIWGNVITNFSAYPLRRIEWVFGVAYSADLKRAEEIIKRTIYEDPRALADPAPWMQVSNLGDFSVDFMVRVWCDAANFWDFKNDMYRAVKENFDREGIEIPFPTRTVFERSE